MNNVISQPVLSDKDEKGMKPGLLLHQQNEVLQVQPCSKKLDSFNELVLQYQDLVYHHACFLVGDPDMAEDIAQESFIRAYQSMYSFRGGSLKAWILRIVTNVSFDQLRRSRRYTVHSLFPYSTDDEELESPPWLADPSPSVQEIVEGNEATRCLIQALKELPEAYRIVITLIDFYELDYQEAAEILEIPIGTIKSRLARGRLQMREKMKAQELIPVYGSAGAVVLVC